MIDIQIVLHAFGKIDPSVMAEVQSCVRKRFGVQVQVGEEFELPAEAFISSRNQYLSSVLLQKLSEVQGTRTAIRLGITEVDLYLPGLNFVSGSASLEKHLAVFSTARLDPQVYREKDDPELFLSRVVAEAIHELGHTPWAGALRAPQMRDVVPQHSFETDQKGSSFCPRCERLVSAAPSGAAAGQKAS